MTMQRADVRQHWPRMAAAVAVCLEGMPETPEEIYAALRYEKAALYVCEDGFVVLWPLQAPAGQPQRFEVTCAARWAGIGEKHAIERLLPEVETIAREAGAKALTCRTNKPFMAALLYRWKAKFTEYELEL